LLEDWYLKPWKTTQTFLQKKPQKGRLRQESKRHKWSGGTAQTLRQQEQRIDNYNQSIIELVEKLLAKA